MIYLPLTLASTAFLGILYFALITQVILLRRRHKVAFGDGEHKDLRGAIRAQANANEQIPLFLIGLGLLELSGMSTLWLGLIALIFLGGRVLNGYGMCFGIHSYRVYGTMATLTGLLLTFVSLIIAFFTGWSA